MANLPRYALSDKQLKTVSEYAQSPFIWQFYQKYQDAGNGVKSIWFGGLPSTAVSAGTVTVLYDNQPQATTAEAIPDWKAVVQMVPLTTKGSKPYPQIGITAAAAGRKFTIPTTSIEQGGFMRLTVKVSVNTPTLTIALESTTTADTITFATVSTAHLTAGQWGTITLPISAGALAGSVNYNVIKAITITGSAAVNVDAYEVQFANNQSTFIGSRISTIFNCLTEVGLEMDRTIEQIKCYNYTEDTSVSDMEYKITLTAGKLNLVQMAALFGETPINDSKALTVEMINGNGGASQALAIAANTINLNSAVNINNLIVVLDGAVLTPVSSTGNMSPSTYHATSAGVLTFSGADGRVPDIYEIKLTDGTYIQAKNLKTSYEGPMIFTRVISDGVSMPMFFPRVQLTAYTPTQDDGSVTIEAEFTVLPVKKGNNYVFMEQGIL